MEWIKQQNAATSKEFANSPGFDAMRDRILEVLDSDARIPGINRMGPYLYNFWRDK
jgi:prolyl oligopeptidase